MFRDLIESIRFESSQSSASQQKIVRKRTGRDASPIIKRAEVKSKQAKIRQMGRRAAQDITVQDHNLREEEEYHSNPSEISDIAKSKTDDADSHTHFNNDPELIKRTSARMHRTVHLHGHKAHSEARDSHTRASNAWKYYAARYKKNPRFAKSVKPSLQKAAAHTKAAERHDRIAKSHLALHDDGDPNNRRPIDMGD